MAKQVTIKVLSVGANFGFSGVVCDARSGRRVRVSTMGKRHTIETDVVPSREAAIARATRLAEARGYEVL